ncbi:hypothetical protein TNIN_217461 [Trichonephila inaurata madagascariensis]|uniref:Uncharacterized protein n=1 Tax=Trichonephila inaurata madagascariensis TaxID=2747483 RepID=A0A8X7CBZ6_9ARAC|nr:hypothetical protein TNIN_217461 [Trichonephila inaurata madagascariensis]
MAVLTCPKSIPSWTGLRNGINESTNFSTPSNRIKIPNIPSLTQVVTLDPKAIERVDLCTSGLFPICSRLTFLKYSDPPLPMRHFHNHLIPHLFPGDSKSALTTVRTRYWRKSPLGARNANTVEIVGDILKPGTGQHTWDEIGLK